MFRHPCTIATFASAAALANDYTADLERADGEPVISQSLRLADILATEGGSEGPLHPAMLVAAVLLPAHRLGELTVEDVGEQLGDEAQAYLADISKFKLLDELEEGEVAQAHSLDGLSHSARFVLLADMLNNLRYLANGPQDEWPFERALAYRDWAKQTAEQLSDVDELLCDALLREALDFQKVYAENAQAQEAEAQEKG
jgi:(p)ppGpp synthase/HD superfamily hydrolase